MEKRATFVTKIGVIAATVGSSVGLGNIWRFPTEMGNNGGGAFLLIYLAFVLLLGIPVMLAEFTIGRRAHADVSNSFKKLAPGTRWHYVGYLGVVAAILIMGFYSVIAGWTLEYVYQSITNTLASGTPHEVGIAFKAFTSNAYRPLFWVFVFLMANYVIISRGVRGGIEKMSNILMPLLFLILLLFCVRSFFLEGAGEGLRFMFNPDFSKISANVILSAMGQAFFSLSLGMGTLITYASYFSKETSLPRTAVTVGVLDTLVALVAGIIIFPALFSFGGAEAAEAGGPELIFVTLPSVFQSMPAPFIWSTLFFLLITVAALTSTISLCEVAVAFLHEHFGFTRRRASQVVVGMSLLLATFCSLSFGAMSDVTLGGKTIFDMCDFIASNILLPLGGMLVSIFVGWRLERTLVREELTNMGATRAPYFGVLIFILKYVAPLLISLIFLSGLGIFNF